LGCSGAVVLEVRDDGGRVRGYVECRL
jgi:hypothetical protein